MVSAARHDRRCGDRACSRSRGSVHLAGLALVALSVLRLSPSALEAMGPPLLMIAALIVLSELRPIVMTRLVGNPVSISLAFVFAAMYLWGLYPAVLLHAGAVLLFELLQRKPPWKVLFNVGQDVASVTAAWLVLLAAGVAPSPFAPHADLSGADLWWIVGSWVVYHLVNLTLVAGMARLRPDLVGVLHRGVLVLHGLSRGGVGPVAADRHRRGRLSVLLDPAAAAAAAAAGCSEGGRDVAATGAPGVARPADRSAQPTAADRPDRTGVGPFRPVRGTSW